MIAKYLKYYKRGSHCASTSLVNICSYYGLNLSEDMCFGLGQALGFSFYKNELMNTYSFSGRSRDIYRNFFDSLCIDVICGYGYNNNQTWSELDYYVNNCEYPVLVKLNINSLHYLKEYFKLKREIEQSEHLAVIIGIEKEKVIISEYYRNEPVIITKLELLNGLNKRFEEKAINNIYYVIRKVPININMATSIRIALLKNTHQMMYGFGSNLGLTGLSRLVHDIKIMYETMEQKQFENMLIMALLSFEKIGTGGGNFRRMYARFLKECAVIFQDKKLLEIMDIYLLSAKEWKRLCKYIELFLTYKEKEHALLFIYQTLDKILKYEKKGIQELYEYSKL